MVKIFGGKDSRVCRRALRWMEERGISYQYFDLEAAQIEETLLGVWIDTFGWRMLIDKRTAAWRSQPADIRNTCSAAEVRALLIRLPDMLKKPILTTGGIWLLGWNAPNKVRLLGQIRRNSAMPEHYSLKTTRPPLLF